MSRVRRIAVIAFAVALLGIGSTVQLRTSADAPPPADPISELRGSHVRELYQTFANRQDAMGGDANMTVALGRARDHSAEARLGGGNARINMKTGRITAEVSGLDTQKQYDLWLIDNNMNTGESALPDPDDKMIRVGTLTANGKTLSVSEQIDVKTFDQFQIDMVVVSHKGEQPDKAGVLYGSMTLFQRVYAALGSPERLAASDFAKAAQRGPATEPGMLTVRTAYAQALFQPIQNVFVDSDVLFTALVRRGSDLFFNGTFNGNGRTCGTCHPAHNNVTIDVAFIENLNDDSPLFAAEFIPALAANFENPRLMRGAALIQENLDGFDNLARKFVMRSVPHTLGLSQTIAPTNVPFDNTVPPNSNFPPGFPASRTGWGGDGAPNSGSLRDFATGAVTQHFPLTLNRVNGVDFRLPNAAELDAMEAFQLALGRRAEVNVNALRLRDARAVLGRDLFNRLDTGNPAKTTFTIGPNPAPQGRPIAAGKCTLCHENAGATLNRAAFGQLLRSVPPAPGSPPLPSVISGNANFATGVNDLRALPADLLDRTRNPRDGGFGIVPHDNATRLPQIGNVPCGNGRGGFGVVTLPGGVLQPGQCEEDFNAQSLIEAADTPPFFHNNAVNTLEAAIAFYNDDALNNSIGGQLLRAIDTNGIGIRLDTTEVTAIASFLRVLNALENIRQSRETLDAAIVGILVAGADDVNQLLDNVRSETEDAFEVLKDGQIHPVAQARLRSAFNILNSSLRVLQLSSIQTLLTQAQRDLVDP